MIFRRAPPSGSTGMAWPDRVLGGVGLAYVRRHETPPGGSPGEKAVLDWRDVSGSVDRRRLSGGPARDGRAHVFSRVLAHRLGWRRPFGRRRSRAGAVVRHGAGRGFRTGPKPDLPGRAGPSAPHDSRRGLPAAPARALKPWPRAVTAQASAAKRRAVPGRLVGCPPPGHPPRAFSNPQLFGISSTSLHVREENLWYPA